MKHLGQKHTQAFKGWAGGDRKLGFRQNERSIDAEYALTFLYHFRPAASGHKAGDEARVDQVERAIGKVERFSCIHHAEMGVLSSLCRGNRASIVDHKFAGIEASHLYLWVGLRHLKRPGAGAAGNVEYIVDLANIESLREKSSANPGRNASLPAQAAHLRCVLYFNGIFPLSFLGRGIW